MHKSKKTDLLYDLGSGDGRIVIMAAKRFGCKAVGFEFNKKLVKKARDRAKEKGVDDLVTIEEKNFFTVDLSNVDVLTLYLMPRPLEKLKPQLAKLRPGTRVVCHDFGLKWLEPDRTVKMKSKQSPMEHTVFLYVWK